MRGATSPRLLLELMCAQVLLPARAEDQPSLAERLDRLERKLSAAPLRPEGRPPAARQETVRPESARPEPDGVERARSGPARPDSVPPESARPASARPAPAARGQVRSEPARQSAAPADTETLRARWPDVLEAVQGRKRVAWMQLSNASVDSFADGVLTLTFAQAGIEKGFLTGGYDKDLSQVLSALYGITPHIRTAVRSDR